MPIFVKAIFYFYENPFFIIFFAQLLWLDKEFSVREMINQLNKLIH